MAERGRPPSEIQRYPSGLVSALDIKDRQTPAFIDPNIALEFDSSEFYLAPQDRMTVATAAGVLAVGDAATIVIPALELWIVRQISFSVSSSTVGQTLGCAIRGTPQVPGSAGLAIFLTDRQTAVLATGDNVSVTWQGFKAFGPGSDFRGFISQITAGTVAVSLSVLAHVLTR